MIESALVQLLMGNTDVSASIEDRIYPHTLIPQNVVKPFLAYHRISTNTRYTNDGDVGAPDCLIQLDVRADKYKQAKQIAKSVKSLLSGYHGTVAVGEGTDVINYQIDAIFIEDIGDLQDPEYPGQERAPQGERLDLRVHYQD